MSRFILSGFADELATALDEQLRTMNELGIGYIEMRNVDGRNIVHHDFDSVREVRRKIDAAGIRISALGTPLGKLRIDEPFAEHFEKFKHAVEIARLLETRYLRMFSFFIPAGEDPADHRSDVMERWTRFVEYSTPAGLTLLHENEKFIYGDTVARCKDLLDTFKGKNVRAIFDPANFIQCDEVAYPDGLETLLPYVAYIHVKDANAQGGVVPSGEGVGNIRGILSALNANGYDGFLSLEPHLLTGEIDVCGRELFVKALDALKGILKDLDIVPE
jgi:sugar phosphate isomerase/epimerase